MKVLALKTMGDYSLIVRITDDGLLVPVAPYVIAYKYNKKNKDWEHGKYFEDIDNALNYLKVKNSMPHYDRLNEIASHSIQALIEYDEIIASDVLTDDLDITPEEVSYFNINPDLFDEL